jgi:hypothetical protein
MSAPWIKSVFALAAFYDGALGLAFLVAPLAIFRHFGVEAPNHLGYVQFPALLLLIFAAMFARIAADPVRRRELMPYGMGFKAAYCGAVLYHQLGDGVPAMWIPWAWADLGFLVLFAAAWWHTGRKSAGRA